MKRYRWLARAAAALVALEALVLAAARNAAYATTPALCERTPVGLEASADW
jgi:hypothetical protein